MVSGKTTRMQDERIIAQDTPEDVDKVNEATPCRLGRWKGDCLRQHSLIYYLADNEGLLCYLIAPFSILLSSGNKSLKC